MRFTLILYWLKYVCSISGGNSGEGMYEVIPNVDVWKYPIEFIVHIQHILASKIVWDGNSMLCSERERL